MEQLVVLCIGYKTKLLSYIMLRHAAVYYFSVLHRQPSSIILFEWLTGLHNYIV